jgi:glycosyltransferase involved in cell wall biosynthesis
MGIGGAERQAVQLAERLDWRGHEVEIFSLLGPQPEEWTATVPVTYLHLARGLHALPAACLRAAREMQRFEPDILHAHCFHGNMFARLLRAVLPDVRIVSTVHNVFEGGFARMLLYRLTNMLSDRTAFVCRAGADRYLKLHAASPDRVEILPNGIEPSAFVHLHDRRIRVRSVLRARNDFIWLAVGRLAAAKDYPTLLRAFSLVYSSWPEMQLWIAGQGTVEARTKLEALAAELRIEDGIRWLGLRRDVPSLLDACDGFVFSSAWEGMPLAVAEAMAMEKPVVGTEAGGVAELVGPRACLVPIEQPAQLACSMLSTMRTPVPLLEDFGIAGRRRIVKYFTLDLAAERAEALYHSIVRKRVRRPVLIP